MQRSFSFQFNVVTFQNLCFDENGLNKMVAKKKSWRGENKTIHLRFGRLTKRERERERERERGGGGGGMVGIWVYGGRRGG